MGRKDIPLDEEFNEMLIKSIFSLNEALQSLRDLHPLAMAALSLEDLYKALKATIDLVIFTRRTQEQMRKHANLNKGMREVIPSQDNPGGLIPIKIKSNPIVPFSKSERSFLEKLLVLVTINSKQLLNDSPLIPVFDPVRYSDTYLDMLSYVDKTMIALNKKVKQQESEIKFLKYKRVVDKLQLQAQEQELKRVLQRKSSQKNSRYFAHRRQSRE